MEKDVPVRSGVKTALIEDGEKCAEARFWESNLRCLSDGGPVDDGGGGLSGNEKACVRSWSYWDEAATGCCLVPGRVFVGDAAAVVVRLPGSRLNANCVPGFEGDWDVGPVSSASGSWVRARHCLTGGCRDSGAVRVFVRFLVRLVAVLFLR
ncbi:MAG TPA: hypothetical protein VJB99_01685 [Patescibacteria group bacterium]|nr:hypothetical protein [Patescibacteria group bacterium]